MQDEHPPSSWALDKRLTLLEQSHKVQAEQLAKIAANLTWLVRISLGGVVLAAANFVIRGGLAA